MDVLIIIAVVVLLLQLIPVRNNKQYLFKIIISFLPLFLFGALRYGGGDYESYEITYNMVQKAKTITAEHYHSELGFLYFLKIMPSYLWARVMVALLYYVTFVILFYKYISPKYSFLGFVLFFLSAHHTVFFFFAALRNGIITNILILSLPLILKRKLVWFVGVAILASFIHTSALMSFTIAYVAGTSTPFTRRQFFIWAGLCLFFMMMSSTSLINFITPLIDSNFDRYNKVLDVVSQSTTHSSYLSYIGGSILFGLYTYVMRKYPMPKEGLALSKLGLVFILCYFLGPLNFRLSQVFMPLFIVGAIWSFSINKNEVLKYIQIVFTCILLAYSLNVMIESKHFQKVNAKYETIIDK